MAIFIVGLFTFFGAHLFSALARGPRAAIVEKIGEGPYKGVYSLISIVGFALFVWGWPRADKTVLYVSNFNFVYVAYALMFVALIMLAAAYMPRGRIAHAVKHPMLAAVKTWAFAHLLVNGDVRSLILFGSFLAYGVIDRIAVKRRGAPIPEKGPAINDLWVVIAGAGAWILILVYLHKYIAGVRLYLPFGA
ncbi:MAG TPA: NnrU family protein [Parvularculaceae bacterium]|nr:NnrU family protein [Parvularculaceae bacterium]